ncbi:LysR family transcriptional regulator [Exercitatus varius]|uniref:LysR family transcriptional regulator n=1 Tax=Exercitatus varius TaxID=67857 RepID=A0AAW6Q930_9PAST|nr:LysR family transcriptional regulator [Exercitatus varius]MDG2950035.1 LysR family transcriptional regulator [Exercitatus varius]
MQDFHNLEITWLKDCIVLAEKLNFSQAATTRYVTQSAFSRRIQALEQWVGTPLFVRNRRGVQLTPAGEKFCSKVPEILRIIDNTRNEALDMADKNRSDVVIAATYSLSFSFFPELLRHNHDIARFGAFRLLSDTLHACERTLLQGQSQFLLCHYHPYMQLNLSPENFSSLRLGVDRLIPYSKTEKNGRQPLWAIDNEKKIPYLSFSNESGIGRIIANTAAINRIGDKLKLAFTSDLAATLLAMVKAGDGVAWLPETLAEQDVKNGDIIAATENPDFRLPIEIRLYRSTEKMRKTVEALWDIFIQSAL